MDRRRYRRIDAIFQAALERAPEARGAFLDAACKGERTLRSEVQALIAADEDAGRFLSTPTGGFTASTGVGAEGAAQPLLNRGDVVGRHRIERLVGSGGMAQVYEAEDTRLGRRVALKVLGPRLRSDAAAQQRFLHEARLTSELEHPNICTVFETGEADGHQFIAMRYIEGRTLREVLRSATAPLPTSDAIDIAIQAAAALAAAHAAGVVHRDVTPGNVMVSADGHVTVLDFGIAALEAATQGPAAGTPGYMSPEQALGATLDRRSDVYSLACVLHEMVTGVVPAAGGPGARAVNSQLSDGLSVVLERALAEAPDDRQQDAGALSRELIAVRDASSGSTRRSVLRRWLAAGVGAAALAGAALWWVDAEPGPAGPDAAAHRYYTLGRFHLDTVTPASLVRAVEYFQMSAAADPDYADAWIGLADASLWLERLGVYSDLEGYRRARDAAQRALRLDPARAGPHVALGLVAEGLDWNWAEAERRYRHAVALEPDNAQAHGYLARFLAAMGRGAEAVEQAQVAVRLTPASVTASVDLGFAAYMAGREALALEYLTVALELGPQAPHAHFVTGMVHEARGDFATAADAYRRAVDLSGGRRYVGALGAALARLDRVDEARALLAELLAVPPARGVSPIDVAVLYVGLDETDEAIRWLERLVDEHAWNVHILKAAPQLDPLRADPRFRRLLRRVGFVPEGALARR